MKKLGWYAGSAALILVIGGGMLLLAANLYVQSNGAQQQIRRALSSSLHMPAQLTKTTVSPWEGLRIDGITVHPEAAAGTAESPSSLKVDSFRVRFALGPLLRRRFVVTEVLLDRPQLAWAQDSRGRWRFPPDAVEAAPPPPPPPPVAPGPAESATPAPAEPPAPTAAPPPIVQAPAPVKKPDRFSVDVDKFRLRHGALNFLDGNAALIGSFEEVNLDGRVQGPRRGSGTLWFEKATLPRAGVTLARFGSRFTYDEAAGFTLSEGRGELGGGQLFVNYTVRTAEPGSPFNAECHFDRVAIDRLSPSLGGALQGNLQGVLKASGLAADPASRRGEGHFSLLDGKLKDFPMLKAIGDSLRIEDLSRLEFKTAQFDCHLEGERLLIDSMNLVSKDVRLTAQGTYDTAADKLDLQVRLIIDQAIGRQLPQFIEGNFALLGDESPGSRYVDFSVSGSASKPSTNFLDRVLTGPMTSLFQNMLAPKPKKTDKKPKKPPTPLPAAAASPAPNISPQP